MPHTASLVQTAAIAQVAGPRGGQGAAFVASANTLSMMMSGAAPATAPQQAAGRPINRQTDGYQQVGSRNMSL